MQMPEELVREFARGNGVVFVGAGLSAGAKLPGWKELIKDLRSRLGPECPADAGYPQVAQYFVNAKGHNELVTWLSERLEPGKVRPSPTPAHHALRTVPAPVIFTTNYDHLIEDAFGAQQPHRIVENKDVSFFRPSVTQVVKVHGDLDYPDSIVFTTDDYNNFQLRKRAIARLLDHHLQTHTVLFLGYSFSDYNLQMLLAHGDDATGEFRRRLFTLQWEPDALARAEFERQRIQVVELRRGDGAADVGQATLQWLTEFSRQIAAERTGRQQNHNLPPLVPGLIGRDEDRTRVERALETQVPVVVIEGIQGVGKTRLALEVGHAYADRRIRPASGGLTDAYVVWISARNRSEGRRDWLNHALDTVATTTGRDALAQMPAAQLENKRAQIDDVLKQHPVLIVVDNYETIEDSRLTKWIERVPAPSRVLLTTRPSEPDAFGLSTTVRIHGLTGRSALDLLRRYGEERDVPAVRAADDASLGQLADATVGNPQALWLAVGVLSGDAALGLSQLTAELEDARGRIEAVYNLLFARSWRRLDDIARRVLMVTPLFVGVGSIRPEALRHASNPDVTESAFDTALGECVRSGLLEPDPAASGGEPRYAFHPETRAFARTKLDELAAEEQTAPSRFEREARERVRAYLLTLVRRRVTRSMPSRPYWNALVGDGMLDLDPEWPSIEDVLRRADETGDNEALVALVMLLVHYMDSRFLNEQRLRYVRRAVAVLHAAGRHAEEALLRIDALGWTYVEEGLLDDAIEEIDAGLRTADDVVDEAERRNLHALGLAWRARACMEQKDAATAVDLIARARALDAEPWIKTRVYMAAGDIALKRQDFVQALGLYTRQAQEAQRYGGEGRGYQTLPRLGLAHLGLADLTDHDTYEVAAAEASFLKLQDAVRQLGGVGQLTIGGLYAEYGLALVAHQRGDKAQAVRSITDVREKLRRHTKSNLLLALIKDFEVGRGVRRS